jgi:diadenosine tetraphosphate (Ap4A) HIT family hydrolase
MECRFCNILQKQYNYEEIDKPFFEDDNFFSISSIGSIIEGWTLVIPKEHTFSMKNFYGTKEFDIYMCNFIKIMQDKYGKIIAFEHGTNLLGSPTGCGTDHAHLHIVAFPDSLIQKLYTSNLLWVECKISEIKNFVNNKEYLFYTEIDQNGWKDPKGYLAILDFPISQFFRKLIADYYGKLDKSNYKEFKFLENSIKTVNNLKKTSA